MKFILAKNCTRGTRSVGDLWINPRSIAYVAIDDERGVTLVLNGVLNSLVTTSDHAEIMDAIEAAA